MSTSRRATHIGAAACVLGLSLLSQSAGVAAADEGDANPPAQAGSAPDRAKPAPARVARNGRTGTQSRLPAAASRTGDTRRRDSALDRKAISPGPTSARTVAATVPAPAASRSTSEPTPIAGAPQNQPAAPSAVPAQAAAAAAVHRAPAAAAKSRVTQCAVCLGLSAPTIRQGIATAINHVFNNAFDLLSTFSGGPISNFLEGGLVLIRRTLFGFVPTGVSATQTGLSLTVSVNTGSVAYFRTTGTTIEVAGDPGFTNAQQFTASSINHVVAGNSGNAGCAGFVFTEGTAGGDLDTTGIDSMRFESEATFTGKVTVDSVPRILTVSQALRGFAGVTVNAPVILADDTEIDAGFGDAAFTGTVDGKGWFGGQSLLVTALGTTTFAGNVGGNSPLGSLTTRGIEPLQIPQSEDSRTIPLKYMPIGSEVKYGIDVAIGDNAARTYLFDTGGNGFFAGYDATAFSGVTLGTEKTQITYTSGQTLNGLVTPATVTIGSGDQTVSTSGPVDIAAVVSATNSSGQPISPNAPFGTQFAGDFGGAFGVQQIDGKVLYLPGSFITSVLFQLPGNLHTGYLTQLGPIGTTPQMTVGLTPELRAQFPYAVSIDLASWLVPVVYPGTYPGTDYPLLDQFGFAPTYKVTGPDEGDQTVTLGEGPLPSLIDSGAGSTSARLPGLPKPYSTAPQNQAGTLTSGSTFTAKFAPTADGYPDLTWEFTAGTIGSVNQVNYLNETGAATDVPNVNTGLNLFNVFDVMYDVEDRVIRLRPNDGYATVSLQSVTTKGAQTYAQNAELNGTYTTHGRDFSVGGITQLNGSTVVDSGRGDATFSGTVDAATSGIQWLQVNSRGTTQFVRQVGGANALARLTTDSRGSTATAGVATTGAQTYNDELTLNGTYTTTAGAFTAAESATVAGGSSVSTKGGAITFGGRVDSTEGAGNVLGVSAADSTVQFNGPVGALTDHSALGGLNLNPAKGSTYVVTAADEVKLNGALTNSQGAGLYVGDGVTVNFAHGGQVVNFTASGVQFAGDSPSSVIKGFTIADNVYDGIQFNGRNYGGALISDNTIKGNSAYGIETVNATNGLTISNNTIGTEGTTNEWGYTSGGPNAHGIVLAPGDYTATVITDNTIAYNRRDGIAAPNGVQGVVISGNTIQMNQGNGIEFTGGDFTGTIVIGNTIIDNVGDGILLGAGIGQALEDYGNPKAGYRDSTGGQDPNPYVAGHYTLPWVSDPGFYTGVPSDPQVHLKLDGGPQLTVNLDTGSRGLYFDQNRASNLDTSSGTKGFVYLNSSNRLYFGTWVDTTITFPGSTWVGPDTPGTPPVATAKAPVLVVNAVGASMTPPPGSTTPSAVFFTTGDSGTVKITNGTDTREVAVTPGFNGTGSVTIPGGWWATYDDNPNLGPVANFGVGFDRSGLGTEPTTNATNQAYNAFLNLTQMQAGTMRPGYVIANDGVTLGLDEAALQGVSYAYTNLAPSGLSRGTQSAPDWQPATGQVTWTPAAETGQPVQEGDVGPLVIDIGIPTGILTLPGQSASSTFSGSLKVDLLNSGGAIHYTVEPTDKSNLMSANAVSFFGPLAGAYSQNMPQLSDQFFNTGRRIISGMNYLYDAAGGYEGLWAPDPSMGSPQAQAFKSGGGVFEADYYPNTTIPDGVTNLQIQSNTISGNGGTGITVNGLTSTGDLMNLNLVYGNTGGGIALTNGGNGGQRAAVVTSAVLANTQTVVVTGSVPRNDGYTGTFQLQVFNNPASDAGNVQGRQLIGTISNVSDRFSAPFADPALALGDFITVIATPEEDAPNSSEFSVPVVVTNG